MKSFVTTGIGGKKLFVNQPGKACIAIDADNGKLEWKYEKQVEHLSCHRTPIYKDGYLLILDDEDTGSVMLKIAPDGSGAEVAKPLDDRLETVGSFKVTGGSDMHFSIPVIHGGRLYIRHDNSLLVYKIAKSETDLAISR